MKMRYSFFRIVMPLLCVLALTIGWCISSSHAEASNKKPASTIKNLIRISITRQNENYTCGVTALQSILGYYGFDRRIGELSTDLQPDPENGTNYLKIADYVKSQGFGVNIRTEMTLGELKEYINQKKPVLLAIQAWADSSSAYSAATNEDGHYVVAIRYDDKNFYFMDPSTLGHYTYIPTADFVSRWHDYDSFGKRILNRFGMIITKSIATPYNPNEIMRLD